MFNTFWIPKYKYELVSWFKQNRGWDLAKFKKRRLYCIYFKERTQHG